ncbi:MAG TPA: hypothetical protein VGH50_01220 [Candidatus Binatia bacterium]|jgi:hypothetical protein
MKRLEITLLFCSLILIGACSSGRVMLANPRTGATLECGASGWGLFAPAATGMVDDCVRRYEPDGYVPVERLTPAERADLERRGVVLR